jgi:hypothetical protein
MPAVNRPLLMRANRLLGGQLVEHNLITIEQLDQANGRLLELVGGENLRQASLLGILAYEQGVMKEEDLLRFQAERLGVGLVDLRHYEVNAETREGLDIPSAWATWTLPFDREEGRTFLASAYYLSPAVRKFWEDKIGGPVTWFGTTQELIAESLETLSGEPTPTAA